MECRLQTAGRNGRVWQLLEHLLLGCLLDDTPPLPSHTCPSFRVANLEGSLGSNTFPSILSLLQDVAYLPWLIHRQNKWFIFSVRNTNRPHLSRIITYAEGAGGSVDMVFGLRPRGCKFNHSSWMPLGVTLARATWSFGWLFIHLYFCHECWGC